MATKWMLPLLFLLFTPCLAFCDSIPLNFDGLTDFESVTTQFAGLFFQNATVLSAGLSLNEFEFPPHSGKNVIFDNGGAISVTFATPVQSFGGFFTYLAPVTISAFNGSHVLIDTAHSLFGSNLALSGAAGSSPNELLDVSSSGGISSVVISGLLGGGSFVVDDVSIDTGVVAVPAPGTLGLIAIGLALLSTTVRSRRRMQP